MENGLKSSILCFCHCKASHLRSSDTGRPEMVWRGISLSIFDLWASFYLRFAIIVSSVLEAMSRPNRFWFHGKMEKKPPTFACIRIIALLRCNKILDNAKDNKGTTVIEIGYCVRVAHLDLNVFSDRMQPRKMAERDAYFNVEADVSICGSSL